MLRIRHVTCIACIRAFVVNAHEKITTAHQPYQSFHAKIAYHEQFELTFTHCEVLSDHSNNFCFMFSIFTELQASLNLTKNSPYLDIAKILPAVHWFHNNFQCFHSDKADPRDENHRNIDSKQWFLSFVQLETIANFCGNAILNKSESLHCLLSLQMLGLNCI